jgi:hypothetical protein
VYSALQNFPRVGLVAYADAFSLSRAWRDDFSISFEPALIAAYADAISDTHFLSSLERTHSENSRWVRFAHGGFFWNERIYIPENFFESEFSTIEIDENHFIDAFEISEKNIYVCPVRRVIFIEENF